VGSERLNRTILIGTRLRRQPIADSISPAAIAAIGDQGPYRINASCNGSSWNDGGNRRKWLREVVPALFRSGNCRCQALRDINVA
jgi:hypothetical protein